MKNIKDIRKLRSTFSVMFYINRTKIKKNGMCQVLGRITVDTGIAQIGTKVEIAPEMWDGKTGRAIGRSKQVLLVNRTIDRLMEQAAKYYDDLVDLRGFVTAEGVKNALKGIGRRPETLLTLFEEHNEEFAKRVGVNRVKETLDHYKRTSVLLKMFLNDKYFDKRTLYLLGVITLACGRSSENFIQFFRRDLPGILRYISGDKYIGFFGSFDIFRFRGSGWRRLASRR